MSSARILPTARQRANASSASAAFPRWVALGSLALVLWLFFANTVPAARERSELLQVATDLQDLRQRFDVAIRERRLGLARESSLDMQAVLVAIDQQGFTPAELCATYPQAEATPPAIPPANRRPPTAR